MAIINGYTQLSMLIMATHVVLLLQNWIGAAWASMDHKRLAALKCVKVAFSGRIPSIQANQANPPPANNIVLPRFPIYPASHLSLTSNEEDNGTIIVFILAAMDLDARPNPSMTWFPTVAKLAAGALIQAQALVIYLNSDIVRERLRMPNPTVQQFREIAADWLALNSPDDVLEPRPDNIYWKLALETAQAAERVGLTLNELHEYLENPKPKVGLLFQLQSQETQASLGLLRYPQKLRQQAFSIP